MLPSRDARYAAEIRQLQQELQLASGQAKEQAQQLEHGRSVQQNLMAARAQLDEGYREAQERLVQAEEELDELRAQGARVCAKAIGFNSRVSFFFGLGMTWTS